LNIYVFGEGSSGELGLGSKAVDGKKPIDVKRPRLNGNLSAKTVGVVQIAVGGMHCAAITVENKILTWGVNDQGALGRDTKWEGGLRDVEDDKSEDSDSEDGDTDMNPLESTPGEVDTGYFEVGTKFVQVSATDSATFALTEDGSVYGWGTFRVS
jgi:regulator of chromosome condensation